MEALRAAGKLRRKPQNLEEGRINIWGRELDQIELVSRERNPGSRVGVGGRLGLSAWRYVAAFIRRGRIAYISYEKLAEALKCSISAAQEAVQRLVRIGALVVFPQYGWQDGKWVRRPNVYEIRRPRFEARFMPLYKRVRGVKQAAKGLVAGVVKSFKPGSDVSEARAESDRDIKTSEATDCQQAKTCGAPVARRVFSDNAELAPLAKGGFAVKSAAPSRLEVVLARLADGVSRKSAAIASS